MSLRTRLIAGLLALAAVGLVLLAGVTYFEQRHFLYTRVDDQAKQALTAGEQPRAAGTAPAPPWLGGTGAGAAGGADAGGGYGGGYGPPLPADRDRDHMPAGPAAGTFTIERTAAWRTGP